jgi:hypothetical protein
VDGQRVDDAHGVARAQSLELGDDLAMEVGLVEAQHDELNGSDRHRFLSFSRFADARGASFNRRRSASSELDEIALLLQSCPGFRGSHLCRGRHERARDPQHGQDDPEPEQRGVALRNVVRPSANSAVRYRTTSSIQSSIASIRSESTRARVNSISC